VGLAVDHLAAGPADAFAAIAFEGDRFLVLGDQLVIHLVEHFQERHVGQYVMGLVFLEAAGILGVLLPPNA